MTNTSKFQQQHISPRMNEGDIIQNFDEAQIASSDIGMDLWLLEIPIKLVVLVVTGAIALGQWAGEKVGQGIDWLQRSVEKFIESNPSEGNLREIAQGLRDIQRELTQRGLPGAEQVKSIEELVREPLKAKQRERGEDRNPADDKELTKGEKDALKRGNVDIHDLKRDVPGGASKGDLYKDRNGDIYVKPKGGRGYGMETGLNINDFSQYLSDSPLRDEEVAIAVSSQNSDAVNLDASAQVFLDAFNETKGNFEEKITVAVNTVTERNPNLSDDVLAFYAESAYDAYTNQASEVRNQQELG